MEILIAVGGLIASIVAVVVGSTMPSLHGDPGGPALYPTIVAVITGAACLILLIGQIGPRRILNEIGGFPRYVGELKKDVKFTAIFILMLILPFMINWLGFNIATFLFTVAVMVVFKAPIIKGIIYGAFVSGGLYLAYALILGAILPKGEFFS